MSKTLKLILGLIVGLILITLLMLTSLYSYLLFHIICEFLIIIVAVSLFFVAWNSRKYMTNTYLLFLGIAFLFVALIELMHAVSYEGMNIIRDYNYYANQLWVAGRLMESMSVLAGFILLRRPLRHVWVTVLSYFVVTMLVLLSIFVLKNFPVCYIEGTGQTPFNIVAGYVIIAIFAVSILILIVKRNQMDRRTYLLILFSIIASIVSEQLFAFYVSNYDFSNLLGHVFKLLAYFLIYQAVIVNGISDPFNVLFLELKINESKLKKTNERLTDSNKDLQQYANIISHDLKEPVRTVKGFVRLIMKRLDQLGISDAEILELLDTVSQSSDKLAVRIDALLKYSRVENANVHMECIDLNIVLENIRVNLGHLIAETGASVNFSNLPAVTGDATLVVELFQNLVQNGIKYHRDGVAPVVEIGVEEREDVYEISVADNGIGIGKEDFAKLFTIFYRGSLSAPYPGSGIGLAVCKKAAEKLGGRVWLESTVGRGTVFHVELQKAGGDAG